MCMTTERLLKLQASPLVHRDFPSSFSSEMSNIDYLLHTNKAPTATERTIVEGILDETDHKLADIRTTIASYQAKEALLQVQKTGFECILSPIRNLPEDILREIFLQCVDSETILAPLSYKHIPNILTHVCRDFRRLAISIPSFWRRIFISFVSTDQIRPVETEPTLWRARMNVEVIEEWLRRSKALPLVLFFRPANGPFQQQSNQALNLILKERHRWKALHLSFMPKTPLIEQFTALHSTDVPLLTSLVIHHHLANTLEEYRTFDLLKAPNLRQLILRGDSIFLEMTTWSQLTGLELEVVGAPVATIARILHRTTNLVSLSISIDRHMRESADSGEILLPHLIALDLHGGEIVGEWWDPDRDVSLISVIRAPNLIKFRIGEDVNVNGIEHFLEKAPNLREVCTVQLSPDPFLPNWLQYCPQITSLELGYPVLDFSTNFFIPRYSNIHFEWELMGEPDVDECFKRWNIFAATGEVLERFVENENGELWCPNLQNFFCYYALRTSYDTLCAFLQCREDEGSRRPRRQWNAIGLRVDIEDGDGVKEYILADKSQEWPMSVRLEIVS